MKKALLGTSALVAASVLAAGPTTAAEPLKLGLGGYMEQSIGFVDHDVPAAGTAPIGMTQPVRAEKVDIFEETEVHFKGSTTLDNGIKIAVQIELEALSGGTGDQIDESYITFTSPTLGQVIFGSENLPNYKMHYGAPTVSRQGLDSSDYYGFWAPHINTTAEHRLNAAYGNTSGRFFANDPQHIAYYTPRLGGFQLGVGYAPDTSQGNAFRNAGLESGLSAGLNYRGDFDGFGVNASFGVIYWLQDPNANAVAAGSDRTPIFYQGGLNVTFAGFAVGAAYAATPYDATAANNAAAADSFDSWTLNVGASYKTGPYGISIGYQTSEAEGSVTNALSGEDELSTWEVAGTYNLGPGINWHAAIAHISEEGEVVGSTDDIDSLVGVTGIVISF